MENNKILLVDDNPQNIQLLGNVLINNNYTIEFATSGEEALEWIEHSTFDLILLDVMMPGMDGYAVCRKIKSNAAFADIPIIFLTAKIDTQDIIKGLGCGAVDYVAKPFEAKELLARVNTHLSLKNVKEQLLQANAALKLENEKQKAKDEELLQYAGALEKAKQMQEKTMAMLLKKTETLTETNQKLKEANTTKDKLFSIIAHDLRGPIGNIVSLLNMLNNGSIGDIDQDKLMQEFHKSAQHTFTLVEELLVWARMQQKSIEFVPEDVFIHALVTNCFELIQEQANKKEITLVNQTPSMLTCFADYNSIVTVFRNLISNAIKFTPLQGTVKVKAHSTDSQAIIEFCDTGMGISSDNLPKIFQDEGNYTTLGTSDEKGTGLGLVICRDFVKNNNGSIKVKSEPTKGTIFTVYLPIGKYTAREKK